MDPGDPIFWKSESFYPLVNMAITAIFMVDLHMKHGDFPQQTGDFTRGNGNGDFPYCDFTRGYGKTEKITFQRFQSGFGGKHNSSYDTDGMWIGCSRLSKKGIEWGFNGVHDIWVWLEGGHKIAVKP